MKLNEAKMRELESLGFLEKNENIVFLGSNGVGKTHLATSIGIAAAKKRVSTYFIKCNDLIQQLKREIRCSSHLRPKTNKAENP